MALLYKIPVKMLSDLMHSSQLERTIKQGARTRGQRIEALDVVMLEDILKQEVFRQLQYFASAPLAKRRLIEVIKELHATPLDELANTISAAEQIQQLEQSAKQYSLYFDWSEVQRLRSILTTAKTEEAEGRNVDLLLQEGQDLLVEIDRRLQEGLVSQAQDLAEIKASFERIQGVGGREVRRLENLITQIDEAQKQKTLLPSEVERARNITFKLRKTLESSVVQSVPTGSQEEAEAQARVMALEQEHADRLLTDIGRDFILLLRARNDLREEGRELRERLQSGQLTVEEIEKWRAERLEPARIETLTAQRAQLHQLQTEIKRLPNLGDASNNVRVALNVAQATLDGGTLATDELKELENNLSALKHSPEMAARIMEAQRELSELERSARGILGAEKALRGKISAARSALVRGQDVDLSEIWNELQEFMGHAAQQREDLNERADHILHEYDEIRSLAGETIQRLGRLADALRAQRRLGVMSAEARKKYQQTIKEAESLLSEARAEYQAAQEITSTFGSDALSGLLDVFDFEEGASPAAQAEQPAPEQVTPQVPQATTENTVGQPQRWKVTEGVVLAGMSDEKATGIAALLAQAERLGLTRLDMGDSTHVWSARQTDLKDWRLARARNWDDLEEESGKWLDYGTD